MSDTAGIHDTPSTLLGQRARNGLIAIAELEDARNATADLQVLKNACQRAEEITLRLRTTRAVAAELSELGLETEIKGLAAAAAAARRQLRTVASSAEAPSLTSRLRSDTTEAALKDARNAADQLETQLRRAVTLESARLRPEGLDSLASVLPRGEPVSAQLSMLQHSFEVQRNKPLQELPGVVRKWREHADHWGEIRSAAEDALGRLHPEVQAFMKAAATSRGAAWSMITPAVRDWLDLNNNSTGYRTRFTDGL